MTRNRTKTFTKRFNTTAAYSSNLFPPPAGVEPPDNTQRLVFPGLLCYSLASDIDLLLVVPRLARRRAAARPARALARWRLWRDFHARPVCDALRLELQAARAHLQADGALCAARRTGFLRHRHRYSITRWGGVRRKVLHR